MDLVTVMRWTAERFPERAAVRGRGRHLAYREWDARTDQLARALRADGVRPGDRVAFALSGGEPLASLHLAAQKLGAVSVPLSTRFSPDELRYCVDDSAARLLVTDEANAERAAAAAGEVAVRHVGEVDARAEREPDHALDTHPAETDVSVMLYTSGTTGRPKGVPRTHRAEHSAAVAHAVNSSSKWRGSDGAMCRR